MTPSFLLNLLLHFSLASSSVILRFLASLLEQGPLSMFVQHRTQKGHDVDSDLCAEQVLCQC